MNKKELSYIKESYFNKTFDAGDLMSLINEVLETGVMHEEMSQDGVLTLQAIPEIDVTELGWTDVRTVGDQKVSGPARNQLLQFLKNVQGADLEEKIKNLSDFYTDPDALLTLEEGNPGQRIANALSYLVFYKTLTKVISNFNAASAGFNFEAFLAVLLAGQQIKANTGTIADFTAGDNTPISLKLYNEKSLVVGGSFVDLVGDLVSPQFSPHDYMQYVVVLKSFEGEAKQGLDVKGQLKFYRFNFTLDNVANLVLNSMGKSTRCIEMPNEMIKNFKEGNTDFDYGTTLPSQENLPSNEEMETAFINALNDRLQKPFIVNVRKGGVATPTEYKLPLTPEDVDDFTTNSLDWANNEELFNLVKRGEKMMVVRGSSAVNKTNRALQAAVINTFGESGMGKVELKLIAQAVSEATAVVNDSYTATRQKDQRRNILKQSGVFADAQTSADFYNKLTDPELKKRALMNSRGVLSTLQFDLNRGQVLDIENLSGEYPTLPEGQGSVDIGTIMIGAVYVQEVLNKLTQELNQSIFSIFQSVKMIQEGTYAFMAGGLQDDEQAAKAIKASQAVQTKTQELRPGGHEQLNLDL